MGKRISYKDLVKTYNKKYQTAAHYPKFMKLKRKGWKKNKLKKVFNSKIPDSTFYFWFEGIKVPEPFRVYQGIKKDFGEKDIENLAIILGHIFGDGSISRNYGVNYCNTEKFLINEFCRAMESVFNEEAYIKNEGNITRVRHTTKIGRILHCLFGNFALGRDTKRITRKIEEMPLGWKTKMLRTWFNDDGSVPEWESYRVISFKQKKKDLVLFVQEVLAEAKINSHLSKDGARWQLRITSYKDMKRFKEKIGFSEGYRKQKHLDEIIRMLKTPHWKTKLKILELLRTGPKTRKDLVKQIDLDVGTIYGHLHGWKRKSDKKSTQGLIDIKLVKVKKDGKKNVYFLNKKEYKKFKKKLNLEKLFKNQKGDMPSF